MTELHESDAGQVTPALDTSHSVVAVKVPMPPAPTVPGTTVTATETGIIWIVALIDLVESSIEVAVTVTVPPDGMAVGAVNRVGLPLAI